MCLSFESKLDSKSKVQGPTICFRELVRKRAWFFRFLYRISWEFEISAESGSTLSAAISYSHVTVFDVFSHDSHFRESNFESNSRMALLPQSIRIKYNTISKVSAEYAVIVTHNVITNNNCCECKVCSLCDSVVSVVCCNLAHTVFKFPPLDLGPWSLKFNSKERVLRSCTQSRTQRSKVPREPQRGTLDL